MKKVVKNLIISLIMLFLVFASFDINTEKAHAENTENQLEKYYCLRDEMYINTPDQLNYNTCWIFALTKCLETTLAKKNNEYYDFSEAYIILAERYNWIGASRLLGSVGGDVSLYLDLIQKYGLVNEIDFNQDELAYIGEDNYKDRFNYYSKYSSKELVDQIESVNYNFSDTKAIKAHIKEYGAVNLNAVVSGAGHALTAIGWDDEQSSFIVLNSYGNEWGNDGVNYVQYNSKAIVKVSAFKCNGEEKIKCKNTPEYEIKIVGKYKKNAENLTKLAIHNNLFYCKDQQEMKYEVQENVKKVLLEKDGVRENINFEQSQNVVTINLNSAKMLDSVYKLIFKFENSNDEYVKLVYFVKDVEFEKIKFLYNSQIPERYYYENFNSYDDTILVKSEPNVEKKIILVKSPYTNCSVETESNVACVDNGKTIEIISQDKTVGNYEYLISLSNGSYKKVYTIKYCVSDTVNIANIKTESKNKSLPRLVFIDENSFSFESNSNSVFLIKQNEEKQLEKDTDKYTISKEELKFANIKNQSNKFHDASDYSYSAIVKIVENKPVLNVNIIDKSQNISTNINKNDKFTISIDNVDVQVKNVQYFSKGNEIDLDKYEFDTGENEITIVVTYIYNDVEYQDEVVKVVNIIDTAPPQQEIEDNNENKPSIEDSNNKNDNVSNPSVDNVDDTNDKKENINVIENKMSRKKQLAYVLVGATMAVGLAGLIISVVSNRRRSK